MAQVKKKKILVILESPNKIKAVSEILRKLDPVNEYTVKASCGHITNLCKTGKYNLGIDLDTFEEEYEVDPEKTDVVKKLKAEIKAADLIYLATDGDTEGTYISWLLVKVLKIPVSKTKRVIFTEITKNGVEAGLKNAGKIDDNVVESARMRRELDRIIGFRCSNTVRAVSAKAAGRVQSTALKIICDREHEIKNFKPVDYFEIFLKFNKSGKKTEYTAKYRGTTTKKITSISSEKDAKKVVDECNKTNKYVVDAINQKEKSITPKPPYTTATFQQEALAKFNISSKKCMQIAQALFEGKQLSNSTHGLITYMRTDSTRLAPEFVDTAKTFIEKNFGKQYYTGPRATKQQVGAQDAHEAIRVTDIELTPDAVKQYLDSSELKIYTLIYNRTLASVMSNAKALSTEVQIKNGNHIFSLSGTVYTFEGYRKIYTEYGEDEEGKLDATFKIGDVLNKTALDIVKKTTTPPSRFSEASLVKKLADSGVGRPSTYAPTIELLKNHEYVTVEGKALVPTDLGEKSNTIMEQYFPEYIVPEYTAGMEAKMDDVAAGKLLRISELESFYKDFDKVVKTANQNIKEQKAPLELLDEKCEQCGAPLVARTSKYGLFYACSRYPHCRFTKKPGSTSTDKTKSEITDIKCPKCKKGFLVKRKNKKGTFFYGCSLWSKTKCDGMMTVDEFEKIKK